MMMRSASAEHHEITFYTLYFFFFLFSLYQFPSIACTPCPPVTFVLYPLNETIKKAPIIFIRRCRRALAKHLTDIYTYIFLVKGVPVILEFFCVPITPFLGENLHLSLSYIHFILSLYLHGGKVHQFLPRIR